MSNSHPIAFDTSSLGYNGELADYKCTVNTFPKPFSLSSTSYFQEDFDPEIKQASDTAEFRKQLRVSKVIIVGDVAIGKTCLVNRFCHKKFNVSYKGTIGVDFEVKKFEVLQSRFNLQLWDTAGQERFRSIASSYYRGAHAIILCFDLHRMSSLQSISCWLDEVLQHSSDNPILFVVATKLDLLSPAAYTLVEKDIERVATSINAEFWPVSAKTGKNVQEFFNRVAALTFCRCVRNELEAGPQRQLSTSFVKVTEQKKVKEKKSCRC